MRHLVSVYTHKPDMESAERLIELFINSRQPLLRRDYLIMTGGYAAMGDSGGVMRWIQRMRDESRVKEVDLPWHDMLRVCKVPKCRGYRPESCSTCKQLARKRASRRTGH
jgi:hypothetical protein